jgi:two-component system response regulator YesN
LLSRQNTDEKAKTKKEIHIKILITVTLSVALSIILISSFLYIYFENVIVGKIYKSEKNNLFQAGVSTKLMQELSKSIAIQIYNDFTLAGLFFSAGNDPLETYKALTNLKKYKDLIPYVHSIYIYNPINDTYFINSPAKTIMIQPRRTFFDTDINSVLEKSEFFNTLTPVPRIIKEPGVTRDFSEPYGVYTFVYNLSGARTMEHPGTIIINISEEWVRDIIDSVDINPDIKVLIIDKDDRLLIDDTKNSMLSKADIYPFIKDKVGSGKKSGSLLLDIRGKKTLLVFSLVDSVNWIFVKLIPYAHIMTGIFEMRKNLLIIAIFILLIGTLFSFISARRLYKPIDDIIKKLAVIEEEKKSDTLILKQHNFKRLLLQSNKLSDYELNKFLDDLDIGFEKNDSYGLLMLVIDHYMQFRENYSDHEQNLLRVGIIDAGSRLLDTRYRNEGIESDDNQLVYIVNIKNENENIYKTTIRNLAREIQTSIENAFGISVSVIISSARETRKDVSLLYEDIVQMSHYKYLLGYEMLIDGETIARMHENATAFTYPYEKEKNLIEAMHCGDKDKLLSAYGDIIENAVPYGYNALITTRNTIAYTINKTINKLLKHNLLNYSFNFYNFFSKLICSETINESNNLFFGLFDSLLEAIEKRNSSLHQSLISEIIAIIQKEYPDINLGISTFAYKYKLSAAYLGRLFKDNTGKPMYDYINEIRVSKVNELLRNSSFSIVKIMEMTGFTNKTHLYKIFKKYNGVTPKLYRQKIIGK